MKNIYIGNLDFNTSDDQLRALFAAHGSVEKITSGQPCGFAFLEMSEDSEAEEAIRTLNGTLLDGRALTVNEARRKPGR